MRIIFGKANTKLQGEDFAITPYLALVKVRKNFKITGVSLCWFYQSVFIVFASGLPDNCPTFINLDNFVKNDE